MVTLIRAAALRGFDSLVAELGGDAAGYLRRTGIDLAAVSDDDALLPTDQFASCLTLAAGELGHPELPLLLSQRQDLGVLGPLAVALESAPSVGEALACADRFLFMHASAATVSVAPDPRGEAGVLAIRLGPDALPLGLELGLGLLHRLLLLFCSDVQFCAEGAESRGYGLRGAHLPGPPIAAESIYREVFR
ncbi:MAG: AraC family transcriptional regulator ligand-binding domain-containing protein, partial [Mobilicoccus sp.]|nr:AraC family transcriptional regulator ligand-binding domain-containing protein [Mobilicoccus sp.]